MMEGERSRSAGRRTPGKGVGNQTFIRTGIVLLAVLCIAVVLVKLGKKTGTVTIAGYTPYDQENPSQGILLDNPELVLESIGYYDGIYVEDGSDEKTEAVAAAVFTNHSEKMLQIAEVSIRLDGESDALFRLTNIPSGKSVLVLDRNRLEGVRDAEAVHLSDAAAFFEEVPMAEKELAAKGAHGRIALENRSEDSFPLVYVYYKTKIDADVYLGGITYRVPYEGVPAMTRVESEALHYDPQKSEIVEIQILGGESSPQDLGESEKEE